jgi:DNA-binding SARP family transcriptional activator/tetratricopeptide (TPR) repeat protein
MDSAAQPPFSLKILGGFELQLRGQVVNLSTGKTASLLAYLACTGPVPQPRERLATLLWSAGNDARARHNLRQAISGLRRILGHDAIIADSATVALRQHVLDCDAARLGRLFGKTSSSALAEATALYGGTLLAGINVDEPAWNDWLTAERERFDELAVGAMVAHAEQELVAGRVGDALHVAHRAVAQNRFREDAHRVLLRSLVAAGRKADAIRRFQDFRDYLKAELGTVPDAGTRQIIDDIAQGDVKGDARSGPMPRVDSSQDGNVTRPDDPASAPGPAPQEAARHRPITVIVCELTGAGRDTTGPDPEDTDALIRPFLAQVAAVAETFGARLLPSASGTAQMVFGYPITKEDDPVQAVRAGIALVQAIADAAPLARAGLVARVGIASGRAVIGAGVMGDAGYAPLVVGDVPHSAMTVLDLTEPGTLAVCPLTRRILPATFDLRVIGPDGAARAWHVAGLQDDAGTRAARRRDGPVQRVGRHEEFDLLYRRLDLAQGGTGRVVLISGEAGVGKTRLVDDLLASPSVQGTAILRYACSQHDENRPLHPFIDRLAWREGMLSARTPIERRDHLEAYVRTNSGNPERDMALLCDLMMLPSDGRFPVLPASAAQKREMLTIAFLDWIVRLASKSPLIVHFEDIHWIDPSSHDVLTRTIDRIADLPVLLVATMRPDHQPVWIGQPHVTMLHLSRLDPGESADLVRVVTGDTPLASAIVDQIVARSDGVPLYIKELTRHILGGDRPQDDTQVTPPLPALPAVPAMLQASLIARIDQSRAYRDVTLAASVIGRSFSFDLIAAVVDMPKGALVETLRQMTAARLMLQIGTPPFAKYAFSHALMCEAAYDMLLKPQRQTLHARIADQLIGPLLASTDSTPAAIAQHLSVAGRMKEAADYYFTASKMAQTRWANREAAQFLDLAIAALDTLPECPATLRQAIDLRFETKNALTPLADFDRIVARLLEVKGILTRIDDDSRLCQFFIHMSQTYGFSGRMTEALRYGEEATALAKRLKNDQLLTEAMVFLGTAQYAVADVSGAKASLLDVLDLVASGPQDRQYLLAGFPDITAGALLARISAMLGQFDEGLRHGTEAVRRAASLSQPYSQAIAQWCLADLHLARGEIAQANVLSKAGFALAQQWDLPTLVAGHTGSLGHAHVLGGNIDEGMHMLEQAIAVFDRMRHHMGLSLFLVPLAAACVQAGQTDKARVMAGRALDLARDYEHRLGEAGALHVLARADMRDGHPALALRHYADALALAEAQGMRPLAARCHHGLGEVYQSLRKQSKANDSLNIAAAMYRDMGMHFWAERTR